MKFIIGALSDVWLLALALVPLQAGRPVEATGVTPEGRILERDLGIWKDDQIPGHKKIVELSKKYGSHIGIQLGHAGRKCGIHSLTTLAPSAIAFNEDYKEPKEMDSEDIWQFLWMKRDQQVVVRNLQIGEIANMTSGGDICLFPHHFCS